MIQNSNPLIEIFGDHIYSKTRNNALEDGTLVDVSTTAQEAGITLPVAVTNAVWQQYIEWTDEDTERQTYQDIDGRLWDVIWMLRTGIKNNINKTTFIYGLFVVPRTGKCRKARETWLKAVLHNDDNGNPVITVMLPTED